MTRIKDAGFRRIKCNPYYQDSNIDDERVFPVCEKIVKEDAIVLMYNCIGLAFDKTGRADRGKIVKETGTFPEIKIAATG